MRKSISKGGMVSSHCSPSIICPYCNRPAFSMINDTYRHFTKNGVVEHTKDQSGNRPRQYKALEAEGDD